MTAEQLAVTPAPPQRRRLRVVHVITTLTAGGAERQVELLAGDSQHDVSVIALFRGGIVEQGLRERGVPVRVLGGMAGAGRLTAVPRLARLLRTLHPDVVHTHLLSGQLWGIPAAHLAGVPVVLTTEHSIMQDTIENRPKTERLRRLYLALNRLTAATIAVSPATVQRLRDWGVPGTDAMPVINPPIDVVALRGGSGDARAELGIAPDAVVIGAVGRLETVKRFGPLLAALAPRLQAGAHLLVVGEGPARAELRAQTEALGVAATVHLVGARSDVGPLLAAMDVFVSPSRDETFGMAAVEAAVAGLPVVYVQCPAFDDLDLPAERFRAVSPTLDAAAERAALAAAVEDLLPAGRDVAATPVALTDRYGAAQTAARVDELYRVLSARVAQRSRRSRAPSARRRRSSGTARP
ncbi:glycosyltransferase [uncultured Jatrophihabitans sp.]|uniref:glycosyltransferase n=1 Tax=uncultured Jatrophihabitans sp. TaxID=1610747 RepID=UPI0035CB6FD1